MHHLRNLSLLYRWLQHPQSIELPMGTGVWEYLSSHMLRMLKRQRETEARLNEALSRFQLAGAAFALRMCRRRGKEQRRGQTRTQPDRRHAPMVRRTPVVETRSLSGICARTTRAKLSPLQCIGITTSGSSFLISATT